MKLHHMQASHVSKRSRRVGRGGKRGKTSGRGGKGQTARAGNKPRPEWRDIIKKFPKRRGYGKNRGRTVVSEPGAIVVNLDALSARFKDGDTVTVSALLSKGMIGLVSGRPPAIKILGTGTLSKKLSFAGVPMSGSAKEKIEKSGGTIVLKSKRPKPKN